MDITLTYDDVLLVPQYNKIKSRRDVDISMKDKMNKIHMELPIFTSPMDCITEHEMAIYIANKGGRGILHRFMDNKKRILQYKLSPLETFIAVGISDNELEMVRKFLDIGACNFCVDVAHGHQKNVGIFLDKIRKLTDGCIIAGNVCTEEGASFLESHGADLIRVGIGGGGACTTRIKTGHGLPNISAIKECSQSVDVSIIADGGIRSSGDIVKALSFGADFVMIGGMLAGTKPTPIFEGTPYKKYYRGSASKEVSNNAKEWRTAEGVSIKVDYRKDEDKIIQDIIGGLRSGLTYSGCKNIKELQINKKYVVITQAGYREGLPKNER